MPSPVTEILRAYDDGYAALLVSGRSLNDLIVDEGKMRPVIEVLRRALRERGLVLVTYSLAGGLDWDAPRITDARDRRTIEQALATHGLAAPAGTPVPTHEEVVRVMRGMTSLSRTPSGAVTWASGQPLRFALIFDFAEHLVPGSMSNGTQTPEQTVAIELSSFVGQSLALRASGNLVVFATSRASLIDELVAGTLHQVPLPQPDSLEKREFLEIALGMYGNARFSDGLTVDSIAHILNHTPNRGLEALLRAADRSQAFLTPRDLTAQKGRDVEALSEGSLTALDTSRAATIRLCGMNAEVPQRILVEHIAAALKRGDAAAPANVLLCGPPGTGKSDMAILIAREAGVAAYEVHSPKRPFVGQTEQLAVLQQQLLNQWSPNLAWCDEITEAAPMQRSDFDGDSGATRAVMAALLTALSDESRRGRSLMVAATNVPWRIGEAMASRWTTVPVLFPLERDFPQIVAATAFRVDHSARIASSDPAVQEAGFLFYSKGASPRHIRAALSNARLLRGEMTAETVIFAADDLCGKADRASVQLADLWAIRCCSSRSFLPWSESPSTYPFPQHLQGLVDPATGDPIDAEITRRVNDLQPHANV